MVANAYKVLPQRQYYYKLGVNLNKEHAFVLEMTVETGVTLNLQEHETVQSMQGEQPLPASLPD